MSWKKIEDRLYTRYCVEIEKDDSITQNLMKQHDKETKSQVINDFLERIKMACSMYTIGCSHSDNSLIYAHSDGTWHNLIEDIANQMKSQANEKLKDTYKVSTCKHHSLVNRLYNDTFEYKSRNTYEFSNIHEFENFIKHKDAVTSDGKKVKLRDNEQIESVMGPPSKVAYAREDGEKEVEAYER